jgi:hypothetical protein
VTDSDELWIEMAQFDTGLADGLWEGLPPPGDAPEWYGKVSALIHAASAPAGPSDLAGEASIVARMQAAVADAAADPPRAIDLRHAVVRRRAVDSPRHLAARRRAAQQEQGHGARLLGRIVAVKAVALSTAVVLGVTAAAATTGIVATVVVPALQDRDQPPVEKPPAIGVDQGGPSGGSESPSGSDGSWPPGCVMLPEICGRDGLGLVGEVPNPGATDDPAGIDTAPGAAESDATDEAVSDATQAGDDGAGTAVTVPPADSAPVETTTTITEPPPTTTPTSEPPPTTATTQLPAPASGTSAGAKAKAPPRAAIVD